MNENGCYDILRSVIATASDLSLSPSERLASLTALIKQRLNLCSVSIFLADHEQRLLTHRYSSLDCTTAGHPCSIPFGEGLAGSTVIQTAVISGPAYLLHADEISAGNEAVFSAFPINGTFGAYGALSLGLPPGRDSNFEPDLIKTITGILSTIIHSHYISFDVDKKLRELTLLYQFSNTMLSTIRLNKLLHLILIALTSTESQLFERAMLFLRNEKTGALQGMIGVTSEMAEGLVSSECGDMLISRWDISDEAIARQRGAEFCSAVRKTRIELDETCSVVRRVAQENRLFSVDDFNCRECHKCEFIGQFGISSFIAAPLMARERSLGIIIVDNPQSHKVISRDDLHTLQLLANQAGMAIENSMLYNRLEDAHSSLRDARERLIHGERLAAIGEMAANLAHELKNPLITIGGFAARLLKQMPADSREQHYADTIVREVCRLEKMLSDILAFSRKPTICYNICDVELILQDCLDSLTTTLEDNSIKLVYVLEGGPFIILGDAHQLKQVFLNLMINACDVMPNGGLLEIHGQKVALDKNCVAISIKDSGGGVPVDMLSKIFNPFFTTKRHGTGLGLAIANRILLNHSGRIEAVNEGAGAVFVVTLPLAETHE